MKFPKPNYKAYEMEEYLDIYFFHPLGFWAANLARLCGLTPDQVTYASMAAGTAGGLLLSRNSWAAAGFSLLIFASVLDSADGQLARMTGVSSVRGRILDGLTGYFMFTASYVGLVVNALSSGRHECVLCLIALAAAGAACSAFQSSMYDFYRTVFSSVSSKGEIPVLSSQDGLGWFLRLAYSGYYVYQRLLAAGHLRLLEFLRRKNPSGSLDENTRRLYVSANRLNIRGWNLLGDNTRFILIGASLLLRRPEWYFAAVLGPLNLVLLAMSAVQRRADKKFTEAIP